MASFKNFLDPAGDADHPQPLINYSLYYRRAFLKIWAKSVQNFPSYIANRWINIASLVEETMIFTMRPNDTQEVWDACKGNYFQRRCSNFSNRARFCFVALRIERLQTQRLILLHRITKSIGNYLKQDSGRSRPGPSLFHLINWFRHPPSPEELIMSRCGPRNQASWKLNITNRSII